MSSCKFESGEKIRVAHQASTLSSDAHESLQEKRLQLAKIAQNVNSSTSGTTRKAAGSKFDIKQTYGSKKPKKAKGSDEDEDDDFLVDEESEEGDGSDDDEFVDDGDEDDDDGPSRKRKAISKVSRIVNDSSDEEKAPKTKRVRTLSDSSEDEWIGKPSLDEKKTMKTRVAERIEKRDKKKNRVVVESDDDDFVDDEVLSDDSDRVQTLKSNVKSAKSEIKKKRNKDSDSDWEEEEGFEEDDDIADGDETPSSDSEDEERKRKKKEKPADKKCRTFFNTATKEDLLIQPRVNEKIADHIMTNRPFETIFDLRKCLQQIRGGSQVIDAYMEGLEKRGILERILEDCKDHADKVTRDFEKMTEGDLQLQLLEGGCVLHDYQKVGVKWLIMMYKKDLNCILGDEMGLGKTIQVISFLAYLKEQNVPGPHLICVPSSTIENWMGELHKWCPKIKLMTYYGNQDERKHIRHKVKKQKETIDVILTTYNMVASKNDDRKFFKNFTMNYVIYDEGHMLKNCDSERYRNLMKVKGKRKILLTGTPLQNNLIELISLMYFVLFKVFNKYCEDISQLLQHFKQQGPALEVKNNSMYQQDRIEQAKLILQPYILRRLKAQVLASLPTKHEYVQEVELLPKQAAIYDDVLDSVKNADGTYNKSYGMLMKLRQAANHPLLTRKLYTEQKLDKIAKLLCSKEDAYKTKKWEHVSEDLEFMSDFQIHQLCEKYRCTQRFLLDENLALESGKCKQLDKMLPKLKEQGDKVLIFSQFTSMLDILEVYLNVNEYTFKRLDGSTPVMERQEMINEFNLSDKLFIFLLSTKAGGLGINLTSANHIIIHDIDFNPYNDKQAEDRCHRMGQKKEVHVTRLISKGTVEVGMHVLAKKKLLLEKQVTTGIKGQIEEEDSNGAPDTEEKIDMKVVETLLSGAMNRSKTIDDESSPSPVPEDNDVKEEA